MTADDSHLPCDEPMVCEACGDDSHLWCVTVGLERDAGPMIAIHDATLRVHGEAA